MCSRHEPMYVFLLHLRIITISKLDDIICCRKQLDYNMKYDNVNEPFASVESDGSTILEP